MTNALYIKTCHIIIEVFSGVLLLLSLVLCVVFAIGVNGDIPTHFDVMGNPTSYGSPWTALILPVTHLICNLTISGIMHFMPIASWNMPGKVTDNNRPYIYNDAVWMLVICHIFLSAIALVSVICTFLFRRHLGAICTIMMVALIASIVFFAVKSYKDAKKYA